jgi:cyclic pyranopterin phosphate synthase
VPAPSTVLHAAAAPGLTDRHGRVARKLRISVTDRCNLRCAYCMPLDPEWLPAADVLTFGEIERLARVALGCGVSKFRLTGGEPLVRRGLPALAAALAALPGLEDLGVTTNGILLAEQAEALAAAGVRSLNISLDTLDPARFRVIARRDGLERVLEGIEAARRSGFRSIKLNAVVVRGLNEDEIPALCRFGRERDLPVRFIEFMPLDGDRAWSRERFVPMAEILERAAEVAPLEPMHDAGDRHSPARRWRFADGGGEVGVIASVSQPFCGACDRVRVTADGKFRSCLFALEETDLRGPLRGGVTDEELAGLLSGAVRAKWAGHEIAAASFLQPARAMNAIGG